MNLGSWDAYEACVLGGSDPAESIDRPARPMVLAEAAMARLHLAEGFTWSALADQWGPEPEKQLGQVVDRLVEEGLLEPFPAGGARLSRRGRRAADHVFGEILQTAM